MSSSNSAFNLQGAIQPNPNAINPLKLGQSLGGTPANNALTSAQGLIAPKINFPSIPTPTTPVKKITTADGTTAEFHAPPTTNTQSNTSGTSSGLVSSGNNSDTSTPPPTPSPTSYPGLVSGLVGAGQTTQTQQNDTASKIAKLRTDLQSGIDGINADPETLNYGVGRINALSTNEAAKENALQGQLSNEIAAGSQNIGALGTAAGLIPEALRYGDASNGNTVMGNSINQAVQLVQNGASPNDPNVQALLAPFGVVGQQAFTTAMQQNQNGGYNPTATSAAVQQNVSQGQSYQGQAAQVDTALKQIDAITPTITQFLSTSGLNSTQNPDVNQALSTYYSKFLNPGNKAIFEQYMGDIKKYTGQILAANSGTIPTDVANTLSTFDPQNLSVSQLVPWLQNLSQLGNNQLAVLQSQASSSYGTGTPAYSGTPTSQSTNNIQAPTTPTSQQPAIPGNQSKVVQAGIGGAMNFFGGIKGIFDSIVGKL